MAREFTLEDAKRMAGESRDWEKGLRASILKWEQIAAGDGESYHYLDPCGFCLVKDNRRRLPDRCAECPAREICRSIFRRPAQETLDALWDLVACKK